MTQSQWVLLVSRIAVICGILSISQWIIIYSCLEKWWRHDLGVSLVLKSAALLGILALTFLSIVLHINRLDSRIIAWSELILLFSITPIMIWRSFIWVREARNGRK